MGGSKKSTVGFRYRMGLHFVLCRGPVDSLDAIICGERSAWSGPVASNATIGIANWGLFGGDKREGGVEGSADVLFGAPTQGQNAYLVAQLGALLPAFRGVLSVVFKGGRIAANNPYIKPWWFHVTRIHAQADGGAEWYAARASVGVGDALGFFRATSDAAWQWQQSGGIVTAPPADPTALAVPGDGWNAAAPAPFGNLYEGGWAIPIASAWTPRRSFWMRQDVTLPAGEDWTVNGFAENAGFVYWDGVFIGSNNAGNANGAPNAFSFSVPPELATPGPHTLAVYGMDEARGDDLSDTYLYATLDGVAVGPPIGMNPAHIVRECLTDPYMRMNYPPAMIDDDAFTAAADAFHAEGMGLNFFWSNQTTVKEFLQMVMDHCGAVYYADPFTGKFVLKPIRGDYDAASLAVFDESSVINVDSFERTGAGEVVNEISVKYTHAETGNDAVVTLQDLASIYSQGAVIADTRNYPGITNADLAARVAQRDLTASTASLARLRVRFTRKAATLRPGDVIKFTWAKLGLSQLICRVMDVSYGGLTSGEIRAELAEDVFGLPASSYQTTQPGGWTPPDDTPQPVAAQHVLEGAYWDVFRESPTADFAALQDTSGFVFTLAAAANSSQYSYSIYSRIAPAAFEQAQDGQGFATKAQLTVAALRSDSTITISDTGGGELGQIVAVGDRLLLPGGRTEEQMVVTDLTNLATGVIGVERGALDTTPQAFAIGTDVWLLQYDEEDFGRDFVERFDGDTVDYKLLSESALGDASIDAATAVSLTFDSRMFRPYPPGKIRIDGEAFPSLPVLNGYLITWAHRDRVQQTASFISQDVDSIGPEAGTTYNVYIYNGDTETLLESSLGISGTSFAPADQAGAFKMRIEIESVRDGVASWERQVREFEFGAIVFTDDVGEPLTDDSDELLTE